MFARLGVSVIGPLIDLDISKDTGREILQRIEQFVAVDERSVMASSHDETAVSSQHEREEVVGVPFSIHQMNAFNAPAAVLDLIDQLAPA